MVALSLHIIIAYRNILFRDCTLLAACIKIAQSVFLIFRQRKVFKVGLSAYFFQRFCIIFARKRSYSKTEIITHKLINSGLVNLKLY